MSSRARSLCTLLALSAVAACNDSIAPGEMATVEIRLQQTALPVPELDFVDTTLVVDRGAVSRLNVVVRDVQFLPADQEPVMKPIPRPGSPWVSRYRSW